MRAATASAGGEAAQAKHGQLDSKSSQSWTARTGAPGQCRDGRAAHRGFSVSNGGCFQRPGGARTDRQRRALFEPGDGRRSESPGVNRGTGSSPRPTDTGLDDDAASGGHSPGGAMAQIGGPCNGCNGHSLRRSRQPGWSGSGGTRSAGRRAKWRRRVKMRLREGRRRTASRRGRRAVARVPRPYKALLYRVQFRHSIGECMLALAASARRPEQVARIRAWSFGRGDRHGAEPGADCGVLPPK